MKLFMMPAGAQGLNLRRDTTALPRSSIGGTSEHHSQRASQQSGQAVAQQLHEGPKWPSAQTKGSGPGFPQEKSFPQESAVQTCGLGQLDAYVFLRQPSNNAMLTPKFLISQQGWKLLLQEPQIPLVWGGLCREKTSSWTDLSLHTRWARAGQDPLNPLGTG